jgi:tripartite-type tricarboxylate transporter receptor subunit TctC
MTIKGAKLINRRLALKISAGALAAWESGAQAQAWPSKTIRLVVPFGAGGPTDVIARVVTQILQTSLNATAIVENKAGAGGALGTKFVAQSDPDGYTLLLGTVATLSALPAVQKNPGFDSVKSFAPVAKLTEATPVLTVPADAPFKTVAELIAYAKANPHKLNYSSAGVGNQTQLNAELFKFKTGTDIVHVPYKSGAEMMGSLLANEAQVAFLDMSTVLPQLEAGKVRALAVTGRTRHPKVPNVPTMAEAGVADFYSSFWTGVLAPAGTPPAIVERLSKVLTEGVQAPDMRDMLARISADVSTLQSAAEFGSFIELEGLKWREAVEKAGIKAE